MNICCIVSAGDNEGKKFSFTYNPTTTLRELHTMVEQRLPGKHIKLHRSDDSPISLSPTSLSLIGTKCVKDVFPYTETVYLSEAGYGEMCQIRVNGSNGEDIYLLHSSDSIGLLKQLILEDENNYNTVNDFTLRLDGLPDYLEESCTIEEVGAKLFSIIHQEPKLRGGNGGSFDMIDVFNDKAVRQRSFNPEAPQWRVIWPGFAALGYCRNSACSASGERVLSNHHFGVFNFDMMGFECPMCKNSIVALHVYFNACFYSIRGFNQNETVQRFIPWRRVGHYYQYWDPKQAAIRKWKSVQITTRPENLAMTVPSNPTLKEAPIQDTCSVCMKRMELSPDISMLQCAHSFHANCINAWQVRNLGQNCPQCHA